MHLPHHSDIELAVQMVVFEFRIQKKEVRIMRYFKLLSILFIMAGLAACEKEILYDDIAGKPLLVVNGLQHVGEPARLAVEKSSFVINAERDFRVKDVEVDLYVNGAFKEALQVRDSLIMETYGIWSEDPDEILTEERLDYGFVYCEGTYLLQEGDALRFVVRSSEFDEAAVVETKMPLTPNVISFDTIRVEEDANGERTIYFALEIDDPSGQDFYNLDGREGLDFFTTNDPVFADFMNIVDVDDLFGNNDYYGRGRYNLFNDAYFDGTRYTVSLKTNFYSYDGQYYEPYIIYVSQVDEAFYQYRKSYNLYHNNDEGLLGWFTEPTQVYSNVQNGVGVVCAQGQAVVFVLDFLEN